MKILRPIGYSELLAEYINYVTPHNIVATGTLNKIINPEITKKTINILIKRHPLLNAYIDHTDYAKFSEANTPHNGHNFDFLENPSDTIGNLIEKQIQLQLTKNKKSMIHVTQISRDTNTTILLTLQHTISDGISISYLFDEMIDIIDKLSSGENISLPARPLNPSLDDLLYGKNLVIKTSILPSLKKSNKLNINEISKRSTGIRKIILNKIQKDKLLLYAKSKNTTVTRTILAILLCISYENMKLRDSKFNANIMVNLRKYLNAQVTSEDLGFYSGYIHLDLDIAEYNTSNLMSLLHSRINEYLDKSKHLEMSRDYKNLIESCNSIENFIDSIKVDKPAIGISNMGITENKDYKNFSLIETHISVSCHAYSRTDNTFFVCMNTYKENMYLNFHHPLPVFSRSKMTKITDDFLTKLDNL